MLQKLKLSGLNCLILLMAAGAAWSQSAPAERFALIVGGVGGQKEFTEKYFAQTSRMHRLLLEEMQYVPENIIYLFEDPTYDPDKIWGEATADNVRKALEELAGKMSSEDQLFVFLVGHGSYDGEWSKFNLVGPDLRAIDFAALLARLPTQKVVFVNTSSASGPFIGKLSGEQRVIITATRSGIEVHETNFADFFMDAFASGEADTDKDNRISLLEAFKYVQTRQDAWYEESRRLRAEHPLLDDNGDGKGKAEFAENEGEGLWASRVYLQPATEMQTILQQAKSGQTAGADSLLLRKAKLQEQLADLKARKAQMQPEEYAQQLEQLLIELARTDQRLREMAETRPGN